MFANLRESLPSAEQINTTAGVCQGKVVPLKDQKDRLSQALLLSCGKDFSWLRAVVQNSRRGESEAAAVFPQSGHLDYCSLWLNLVVCAELDDMAHDY